MQGDRFWHATDDGYASLPLEIYPVNAGRSERSLDRLGQTPEHATHTRRTDVSEAVSQGTLISSSYPASGWSVRDQVQITTIAVPVRRRPLILLGVVLPR